MDFLEKLEELGYTLIPDGQNYRTSAIYRNGAKRNSLCIYPETKSYFDFVESEGGSLRKLIHLTLGNEDYEKTDDWIKTNKIDLSYKRICNLKIKMTKTYDDKYLDKLKDDHSYWTNKKIKLSIIKRFQGGLAVTEGPMKNRYVFPIRNKDKKIIGFSGRHVDWNELKQEIKDIIPKWKHFGETSTWVYPYYFNEESYDKNYVIIVESIGDMLNLYNSGVENVLVSFGLYLSKALKLKLISMDPSKIFISFNNDCDKEINHGLERSYKIKENLGSYFDSDQIIIAQPMKNDFGVMDMDEIISWRAKLEEKHNV